MGGGEVALLNLTTALDTSRYLPLVILAADGPLAAKLQDAGVETHVMPLDLALVETRKEALGLRGLLNLAALGRVIAYAFRLSRWARARGVDVIHTNSLKSDIYGALAGRLARIPVIWHVRDRIADGYLPGPAATLFRRLAHTLPQVVIANSESTRLCLQPASDRVKVVHDGYSPSAFVGSPPPDNPADGMTVSLIGRLAPWKGQHVFIEAAALVLARFPEARFRIVGSPLFGEQEYEQSLKERVAALGIGGRTEFLGFQEDIPGVLARTDIVVHASTHGEPFGQVVIEGMAAGKPVVATEGGALPEIVENGVTGLLTPMGDAPALASALCGLLADPARARALGEAGRRRARDRFTITQTAAKVEAVYDRLLVLDRAPRAVAASEAR